MNRSKRSGESCSTHSRKDDAGSIVALASPEKFELKENYPNPFNPTTEIRYHLPAGQAGTSEISHVTLKVYDILAREVATLVNEVQSAGFKSVTFNASGLASGVYFCRLQAGDFVAMRKMQLLK